MRYLFPAVGLLVLLTGCGGENLKNPPQLTGRVLFQGQPLPGGEIRLRAKDPDSIVQETTAAIRLDGTYLVADAPCGPVDVLVNTEIARALAEMAKSNPHAGLTPVEYVPIPKKYWDYQTSGLGFEIKPGKQSHDFDLTP